MRMRVLFTIALVLTIGVGSLVYAGRTQAQPVAQMPMNPSAPMMGPGQQMPMGQMMGQMQQHMNQMNATVRAMRAHLGKVNPELLTAQERPMYEYLKLLQAHLEAMQGWMGMTQGAMQQMMPRMGR